MSRLVDLIKLVTVNTALGYGFNATAWAMPLNNFGVQRAINKAKELGIPVGFFDARYKMSAPAIPEPGLSYVGQPARYKIVGDIPDSSLILDGGTIFECDPGVYAFAYNSQGRASLPATNFASDALTGCTFKNLNSIGGAGLMAIGSKNMMGAVKCHFEDIGFQDASDWGIRLWNFQQCTFGNRTGRNAVPGGGIQYGFDIPHRPGDPGDAPLLLAGNSTDRDRTFIFNSHFAARGVELHIAPGSQVNQLNFMGGGQVNRFGGPAVDMTLTFESGSANVGFANPAHYDLMVLGGAFSFKTTAINWWEPTRTHFVVAKNDANKTIQLSETMYGTPRTASENNTKVMTYGGYPGLAVAGNATGFTTNVDLGWWDIEIQGNVCSLYGAGFRGLVRVSEVYQSAGAQKATISLRAGSKVLLHTTQGAKSSATANVGVGWADLDGSSSLSIEYQGVNNYKRTTGVTLTASDRGGSIHMTAATDQLITVPVDMDYDFGHSATQDQGSAGKVRYVGAAGVTIPPLAATSGPGKKIQLIQTARNVYTVVGDVGA